MVTPLRAYLALVAVLAAERLAELALSSRNARRLRARGAVEVGRGHYPAMVAMHVAFLAACAGAALASPAPPPAVVAVPALLALAVAHLLRWWAISTLGARWTTRVLVIHGEPPVTGGPYRHLRHPNYLAVVMEMAAVPLVWGSWPVAVVFSAANALVLGFRIRAEEPALGEAWARAFRGRRRLVPGGRRDAA